MQSAPKAGPSGPSLSPVQARPFLPGSFRPPGLADPAPTWLKWLVTACKANSCRLSQISSYLILALRVYGIRVWGRTPVIPALGRLRLKDLEFKAVLRFKANLGT